MLSSLSFFVFFFFNDTATPEIYTLSLHDALPIFAPGNGSLLAARFLSGLPHGAFFGVGAVVATAMVPPERKARSVSLMFLGLTVRSEEHTSELQSHVNLVCRLLLEKKKKKTKKNQ